MTTNIFQDIKDRVDLKDLVRYYGLDVNCLSCARLAASPAARFTTSATLLLKSMKIITTASSVVSTEIMLTSFRSYMVLATSKLQRRSVTILGWGSITVNSPFP